MHEIGAFVAKTHLSQLLDRVMQGETLAITKHGKRVALLVPSASKPTLNAPDAIAGIKALRQKISKRSVKVTLKEIQEMRMVGRK